jgi:hypothetical protein
MEAYFFDQNMRYIGHRKLEEDEEMPINATQEAAEVGDGQEAYLVDGEWDVKQLPPEPVIAG